jgi:cell division protein FtsI (penicillin-binding protein 3)
MEGVVLNGTGKLAHLDGWTSVGKTGSAQKFDPDTGRYSRTQLIASFTGFAPLNNPAVTILVLLDSPVGLHEGGEVAAPVFKRIAEQVLAHLDVPHDVPLNPKFVQASLKRQENASEVALTDFSPVDFSEQPESLPAASQLGEQGVSAQPANLPAVTVAVDQGGDISVPDFSGMTMRDVTEACLRLGLDPVLVGSSLATNQTPAPGAKVRKRARITVQFGTPKPKKANRTRQNRN